MSCMDVKMTITLIHGHILTILFQNNNKKHNGNLLFMQSFGLIPKKIS